MGARPHSAALDPWRAVEMCLAICSGGGWAGGAGACIARGGAKVRRCVSVH